MSLLFYVLVFFQTFYHQKNGLFQKLLFDYDSSLIKEKEPISEWNIKQIHSLVLNRDIENRGVYHKVLVFISIAKTKIAEPMQIQEKISELLEWYKNDTDYDFLTKIALFYLRFGSIHPFIDGGGRTGCLLINLELMELEHPPIDIKFTDRNAYYKAFDSYAESGSSKAMFKLFAKYLIEVLRRYVRIVKDAEEINKQR